MPLETNSSLINKASSSGTDHTGRIFLELARAMVATQRWKRAAQGDGLSAFSTGTSDLFTSNGGLGYTTSGSWNTGGANSFSNALAHMRLQEISDSTLLPTGREVIFQRGSGTAAGNDRLMVVDFGWAAYTGTQNATTARSTSTIRQAVVGTLNGAGGNIWGHLSTSPQIGGAGGQIVSHYWVSSDSRAGGCAPFGFVAYDSTADDPACMLFYDAVVDPAVADAHPCVIMGLGTSGLTWEAGQAVSETPLYWSATGQQIWSVAKDGTAQPCGFQRYTLPDASSRPLGGAVVSDADGDMPIYPLVVWLDQGAGQYKGALESLEFLFPASTAYMFPHTFHATVADAVEPPRLSLGHMCVKWLVGETMLDITSTDRTDVKRVQPFAPAADEVAPTITFNQSGSQAYDATLTVDITDESGLASYAAVLQMSGYPDELVAFWDGSTLTVSSDYDAATSHSAITDGYRLSMKRDAGYPADFTWRLQATDTDGNSSSSTRAFTVSTSPNPAADDGTAPTIELVSPLDGVLSKYEAVVADIDDDRAIRMYVVYAYWESSLIPAELVYSSLGRVTTNYDVTVSEVGGKTRLSITRRAGWHSPPRLVLAVVDTAGNLT